MLYNYLCVFVIILRLNILVLLRHLHVILPLSDETLITIFNTVSVKLFSH